jgi:hypothetical protein
LAYKKGSVLDDKYNYNDIKDLNLPLCTDCMEGRMKRFSKNPSTNHNYNIMQKIACDYKGPFNGFYLFSDYKSDYLFAYPVKFYFIYE